MKRTGRLIDAILQRGNLRLATHKALKGKRDRPDARRWVADLDANMSRLAANLAAGTVPLGRFHQFVIHDPKERIITAPCFEERVLYHAIVNVVEPHLERWLIFDTYACRTGKGRVRRPPGRSCRCTVPWAGGVGPPSGATNCEPPGHRPSRNPSEAVLQWLKGGRPMTESITAVVENGLLRPTAPLGLADGTRVTLTVAVEPPAAPSRKRSPAEILAAIAALPDEGRDPDSQASRDHDHYLYGAPRRS